MRQRHQRPNSAGVRCVRWLRVEGGVTLRSMTGHGQAVAETNGYSAAVEIRTVNNRYFKLNLRGLEGFGALEPQIETLVKQHIDRGTVNLSFRLVAPPDSTSPIVNETAMADYVDQIRRIAATMEIPDAISMDTLLTLPGVVLEANAALVEDHEAAWPAAQGALQKALSTLQQMRRDEGQAMRQDFLQNCQRAAALIEQIAHRAPAVVVAYEKRLTDRIRDLLAQIDKPADPVDVVREVGIFADRCDIAEEIVRLRSHIDQFQNILDTDESCGRKLEFVIQEMFREINTIGSKANDAEISKLVIEVKTLIERMREMVQNVE